MKTFILSIIFSLSAFFSYAGIIEKTYYFDDYKILNSGTYQVVSIDGLYLTGITGEPVLPYQDVKLVLPAGEEAVSMELICDDKLDIPGNFVIFPQQPSRPLSDPGDGTVIKNQEVYSSDQIYPVQQKGILRTEYLNGYAIAISTFTPVKYNPFTGEISFYKKVKIRITTQPGQRSASALNMLSSSVPVSERVERFVQNPAMMKQYPTKSKSGNDYQLLIVTTQQYASDFEDLRDMYLQRGMKSEVVTKETINSSIAGQDAAEKIRNYIIQEYQDNSIEYVLLGGDVELIPYRGFYCYAQSGSGYEDDNIPADLYYSALDGTFNDDGDNLWAEPGEDDLLPEVAVARMPFSNITELNHMINKSTSYQDSPVLGELNHALMAGEWLYSNPDTWGSDYLEMLIGYHDDNGYETWGIPDDYNFTKLYEVNQSWSAADLRAQINAGKQYVHHVGHANSTYVAYMSNSDITDANFSGANGIDHNFTIFQSHGCDCGAFDDNDCIMEKMVTIQNFAVAIIGNSRYGWFNEGQTEGPAAHLHREMMDALYHEKINRIGAAFAEAKIQTAPWVTAPGQWEEGALRWNFYDINILGDPATAIWTDEPVSIQTTYQNAIPVGATSTTVTVTVGGSPVENFSCSVLKDGQLYGMGYTDASGTATINFDPVFTAVGDAELVVSGYNCLPTTYPVTIIPSTGAYVIYTSYQLDDSQGNNNGEPDFGETINLSVDIENVGSVQADNLQINLTTSDNYITMVDGFENVGSLPGNSTLTLDNAFEFEISDAIPDQHLVEFVMNITGNDIWSSTFNMVINAPELSIGAISIDDSQGNNNGILDPGETADISVDFTNTGHCGCDNTNAALTSSCSYLTIVTGTSSPGEITPGSTQTGDFTIELDESAPLGSVVDLGVEVISGAYSAEHLFSLPVGLVVEDFETGDFSAYGWEFDGNADWTITGTNPYEGTYSAKSGAISDQQSSELKITMDVLAEDDISFYRKVSSEESYDYLRFYIDDNEIDSWSGEEGWAEESYPVSQGTHTFKWAYEKDYSVSNGSDCAWIDYIVFPASTGAGNFLSISVMATPTEICLGQSSQLTATAAGGSGNYSYQWTPEAGLSDPTIANPVATPDVSTIYSVTVDDGNGTVSDDVEITVHPVPETPVITQQGTSLVSSAETGNQWYNSEGPISGATSPIYYPLATDHYYVIASNSYGCTSDQSNVIYFIFTSVDEQDANGFNIFPNPTNGEITLEYMITKESPVNITLMNELGRKVETLLGREIQQPGFYSLNKDLSGLPRGIYIVSVKSDEFSFIRKIILSK